MLYLTGFDPRFEQALLIISDQGERTLIMGNECGAYSHIVPFPIQRKLYQHFSLQGQPRESLRPLATILTECGITPQARVGIIGFKYFHAHEIEDAQYQHDVPAYILSAVQNAAKQTQLLNITSLLTNPQDGLRLHLTAKEIAYYEYTANKVSNSLLSMLCGMKPGMRELDLGLCAHADCTPVNAFAMINFGIDQVKIGLKSPGTAVLHDGDPSSVVFSLRGALVARAGMAASSEKGWPTAYADALHRFYQPHWLAVTQWLEGVHVDAHCGEVYERVMGIIGAPEFGVYLNPGHHIEQDEWVNSAFYKGSLQRIQSGHYLQSDIIASCSQSGLVSICEDGVVIADANLRQSLQEAYPQTYARMQLRQQRMRDILGIAIHDDTLPMSNLCGFYTPFFLDPTKVLTKR